MKGLKIMTFCDEILNLHFVQNSYSLVFSEYISWVISASLKRYAWVFIIIYEFLQISIEL